MVLAHTYLFWVKCNPNKTFPPKKFEHEPQNRPSFLPTTKPYPLNTLIRGPPPMYWLGTSRWCPDPLCMLYSIWIYFFLAFTPFLLPLHCLVLLYILVDVYHLWREGCVGFWAHIFFLSSLSGLGIALTKAFIFIACWAHDFFFMVVELLAINPTILLHCATKILSYFLLLTTLWACGLIFLPYQHISSLIPCLRLPWPSYLIFTSFGLISQHSCLVSLFYHFISWASLAHLLLLYLFLLSWAYWPSFLPCQLIKFTDLFLGLPWPIYFFFTSYYFHGLTTSLFGLHQPIYFFFIFCYFHGLASHQSYHFSPMDLFPYFFTFLPLVLFHLPYCWASSVVRPFVNNGHQQSSKGGKDHGPYSGDSIGDFWSLTSIVFGLWMNGCLSFEPECTHAFLGGPIFWRY